MSVFIRILMRIGPLAGTGAIALGLLHWLFHISFLQLHMLLGVVVTLALLASGSVAIFARGLKVLGGSAIGFALLVPVFGVTQIQILVGDFHWLIRVAHLLVGAAAVIFTEQIGRHYIELKQKPVADKEVLQASESDHFVQPT